MAYVNIGNRPTISLLNCNIPLDNLFRLWQLSQNLRQLDFAELSRNPFTVKVLLNSSFKALLIGFPTVLISRPNSSDIFIALRQRNK